MEQERIAKLETKVEAIQDDVNEMKGDIKEIHSRITTQTREVVEKMDDMQTRLEHRMTAQAVASQQQHKEIQDEIRKDVRLVETRVTNLERWKWYLVGGAAVIGYLLAHSDLLAIFIK